VEAGFNTATSRQERKPLQRKSRTTIVSYRGARDVQNTERKLPEKVDTEIGIKQGGNLGASPDKNKSKRRNSEEIEIGIGPDKQRSTTLKF